MGAAVLKVLIDNAPREHYRCCISAMRSIGKVLDEMLNFGLISFSYKAQSVVGMMDIDLYPWFGITDDC